MVTESAASDTLIIGGLSLSMEFIDDPTIPGDTVTIEVSIANESDTYAASGIFFTANMNSVVPGIAVDGALPTNPCGAGSTITGPTILIFAGGSLDPNTSCTFSFEMRVPGGTVEDTYSFITSSLIATMNATGLTLDPAKATLVVTTDLIDLSMSFTDDPVLAEEEVTLQFTLTNTHQVDLASSITFTDDLSLALPGLIALAPLPTEPCGAGSQLTGTTELTLSNGQLNAGTSCSFEVTLLVPDTVSNGESYENSTGDVTAVIDSFNVTGSFATDTLNIGVTPIYMPIVFREYSAPINGPDLIVQSISIVNGNVQIEIHNQGTTAVNDPFWVDLYINPSTPPTMVNQVWESFGSYGAVWGVEGSAIPISAGGTLTLTVNDAYFNSALSNLPGSYPSGTVLYAQVDSANAQTAYGNVRETHELADETYNNILGPVTLP